MPYGDASARLEELRKYGPSRERLRALQPFVVTVYPGQLAVLEMAGAVETVADTVTAVRLPAFAHLYHLTFGLALDAPALPDPATLSC